MPNIGNGGNFRRSVEAVRRTPNHRATLGIAALSPTYMDASASRPGQDVTLAPMPRYANRAHDSGVVAYEIGEGEIVVTFVNGDRYRYGRRRPGAAAVARMQALARAGRGLSTYISQVVRDRYEEKLD